MKKSKISKAAATLLAAAALACGSSDYQPRTRTYFIAADEVRWDYAPQNLNAITGEPFAPDNLFATFDPASGLLGKVYWKSLYREYTDATFTTPKPVLPAWEHLGTLGPVIRAVVGDTIVVHFRNNTHFAASVHPHNVLYAKDSEGTPYADGSIGPDTFDDAVATDDEHIYTWKVPERAGPGPADGSSILSMYHSHVDESDDTNTGLIGPMIITRASAAKEDGSPKDVDREFVNLFTVYDENLSWHLGRNKEEAGCPADPDPTCTEENGNFVEGNLMHSINGRIFGNLEGLVMKRGERVRWYLMGMGTEVDLHTPHWHGQTVTVMGMRSDVASLLPATMVVADMVPDNAGKWLYHCHVNDHIDAGMIATFTVQ